MTIKEKLDFLNEAKQKREILIKESKTQEELELLKQMLVYTKDVYGISSNATIDIMNELAGCAKYIGEYELAINTLEKAREQIAEKFGKNTIEYATTTLNLAEILRFAGKYDDIEIMYKDVMTVYENYDIKDSYYYAGVCNNLGLYYQDKNMPEKALPLHKKSLEILSKNEEYALALATTYNNIAIAYSMLKDYKNADECIEKCLKLYEKEVGKSHSMYSAAINNLAVSLFQKSELEKSLELFKKALFICEASFGKNSLNYEKTKANVELVEETISLRDKKR